MSINKKNIDEWHERFLLGLLDEEEQKRYEDYLTANPRSRKEQREWAKIIRGVEEAAHAGMKREIRHQVEQRKYHDSPYILWYRVAAILFFIVLLPAVIYFNYPGAAPSLALQQSIPAEEEANMEVLNGKETAGGNGTGAEQAPPEKSVPALSPPPAQTENAGYGTAGSAPRQKSQNRRLSSGKAMEAKKSVQRA